MDVKQLDARISYLEEKLRMALGNSSPMIIDQIRDNLHYLKEKRNEIVGLKDKANMVKSSR